MQPEFVPILGTVGTVLAMIMFGSQIEQIWLNCKGQKGPLVMPAFITANCVVWIFYAWFKVPSDWFLIVANLPGPVLGPISFVTALRSRWK